MGVVAHRQPDPHTSTELSKDPTQLWPQPTSSSITD